MTEPVPPLSLSDLKMKLRYGGVIERLSALEELAGYGTAAAPIMADVAEQFRLSPQTFPPTSLTRIYLATRSPELLSALRSVGVGSLRPVGEVRSPRGRASGDGASSP